MLLSINPINPQARLIQQVVDVLSSFTPLIQFTGWAAAFSAKKL